MKPKVKFWEFFDVEKMPNCQFSENRKTEIEDQTSICLIAFTSNPRGCERKFLYHHGHKKSAERPHRTLMVYAPSITGRFPTGYFFWMRIGKASNSMEPNMKIFIEI